MQLKRSRMARAAIVAARGLITSLALGIVVHAQEGAKLRKGETAAQRYRNIRVLKSMPADQLIPTMRKFNASLGVKCNACHVQTGQFEGFERDDKPMKLTARKMIAMAAALNKREKVLKGKVTCYTCHRGKQEPTTMPPIAMMPGGPR